MRVNGPEGISVDFTFEELLDPAYIAFPKEGRLASHNGIDGAIVIGRTPMFGVWKVAFQPMTGNNKGVSFCDMADEADARKVYNDQCQRHCK
jgi:hypothetical protein